MIRLDVPRVSLPYRLPLLAWAMLVAIVVGLLIARLPIISAATVLAPLLLILIYIEPLTGVALMLLAAPWGALESVALGGGLLDSGQLLFLLTFTVWLARGAARRQISIPITAISLPLLVFIVVAAATLGDATSLASGLAEVIKWLEVGLVAMIVIDRTAMLEYRPAYSFSRFLSEGGGWRILLFIILAAAASQALIGIWQFGLRNSGPEHFQIAGGRFFRAYGTFEQPNPFGGFMAWMAALGIGATTGEIMRWIKSRSIDRNQLVWLVMLVAITVVLALALLFSWSRGAWLGFIFGTAIFLLFWPRNRAGGAILLCSALFVTVVLWQSEVLPPLAVERVAGFTEDLRFGDVRGVDINDSNYSVLERLAHWQAALDMARYNLWTGVGFGNYEAAYAAYALINWPDALGHAHNYYLNILSETGVPGLLAYILLWTVVFWQTLVVIRQSNWPRRGAALGLLSAWVALSVHHLLDKLYVNNLYLYLGAMLGVLQVLYARSSNKV